MLKLQCNGDLECLDEEDEEDYQENADKVLLNETTNRLNGRNSTGTNCTVIDSFETIEEIGSICGSNGASGRNEILEKSFNEISPKLDDATTTRGRLRGNGDGRNLLARFKEDILSRFEFQVFLAWYCCHTYSMHCQTSFNFRRCRETIKPQQFKSQSTRSTMP